MSGHKGKILVVDDEVSIRQNLQTRLEMIGYDVVEAIESDPSLPELIVTARGSGYFFQELFLRKQE